MSFPPDKERENPRVQLDHSRPCFIWTPTIAKYPLLQPVCKCLFRKTTTTDLCDLRIQPSWSQCFCRRFFKWRTERTVTVSFHFVATFRFLHPNPQDHPPPFYCRNFLELNLPCAREGMKLKAPIRSSNVRETKLTVEKGVKGVVSKSRMTTNNRIAEFEKEEKGWRGGKTGNYSHC